MNKKIEISKVYQMPLNGDKKPKGWGNPKSQKIKTSKGKRVRKGAWFK